MRKNGNSKKARLGSFCRLRDQQKFWSVTYKVIMTGMVVAGIMFVATSNDLAVKGFIIEDLKAETLAHKKINENLEFRIMELESYENILARAEELKMVKVSSIDYVTVIEGAVAKK